MLKINPINQLNKDSFLLAYKYRHVSDPNILKNIEGLKYDTTGFVRKNKPKEFNIVNVMNELNRRNVKNLRLCGQNSLSGETLDKKPDALKAIRSMGITTIIDLRADDKSEYKKLCEDIGLTYFSFPLQNSYSSMEQVKDAEVFKDKLKQFFEMYNNEKIYIACNYGIDRTNIALSLNYLLNPKGAKVPMIFTWEGNSVKTIINNIYRQIKKILKKLSPSQKSEIGITKYDEENLHKNVKKLQNRNEI